MVRILSFVALGSAFVTAAFAAPIAPQRQVVVVVWDGMRPDFISPTTTPNLWRLVERGVFFAHHHPVYVSATEVNGTAIATGAYPAHSYVIANTDYRPAIDPVKPVGVEKPASVTRGDAVSHGKYLGRVTVAEILHAHEIATAIAGSKQIALLHDRTPRVNAPGVSPVVFEGATLPTELEHDLTTGDRPFPPIAADLDKTARDAWTTDTLIHHLWQKTIPAYSLLWLAEPDASQHATGPGSEQSLAAIRSSDTNLGRVVAELQQRNLLDSTDIMVVSDHGFSTMNRKLDVAADLTQSGLPVMRNTSGELRPGEIIAIGAGGSTLFYVGGHDPETCRRLIALLQTKDWAGVVFSREPADGTFPLGDANIDSPAAPDVVVSLQWSEEKSATGAPGLQTSDLSTASVKVGNHASLSRFDMHNTLVAAGPDFRAGLRDPVPSGNTDVAPTILWCLGLQDEAAKMDGRVLGEALTIEAPSIQSNTTRRFTATRSIGGGTWQQYLQVSEVNGVRYLDEGLGGWSK